ncbi:zinc-ribbon domain-containing protein, partial [Chloroflexota bacterium]
MSVTNLCPHCGTNQRAGARFCRECGKHLATPPATPPAAAPSPPQVVPPPPAPLSGQAPYPAGEPAIQTGEAKTKLYMRPLFWVIMVAVLGLCTCLAGALIGTLSKG